jgi:lipoate-protein ligase A
MGSVEPFLCFQRRSAGDVVIETSDCATGVESTESAAESRTSWKILGSAQRRHRGAILQHGSLLIERSATAPELPGVQDLIGFQLRIDDVTASVCQRLAASIKARLIPDELTEELQSRTADLANTKYGCPTWTKRR